MIYSNFFGVTVYPLKEAEVPGKWEFYLALFFFFFGKLKSCHGHGTIRPGEVGSFSKGATLHKAAISDKEASFLPSLLPPSLLRGGPRCV